VAFYSPVHEKSWQFRLQSIFNWVQFILASQQNVSSSVVWQASSHAC